MTIWRMHVGYWITKATNTLGLHNTYWFSTVIVDARRHFNVSSYVHCLINRRNSDQIVT